MSTENKVIYSVVGVRRFYDKKPVLKDFYRSDAASDQVPTGNEDIRTAALMCGKTLPNRYVLW